MRISEAAFVLQLLPRWFHLDEERATRAEIASVVDRHSLELRRVVELGESCAELLSAERDVLRTFYRTCSAVRRAHPFADAAWTAEFLPGPTWDIRIRGELERLLMSHPGGVSQQERIHIGESVEAFVSRLTRGSALSSGPYLFLTCALLASFVRRGKEGSGDGAPDHATLAEAHEAMRDLPDPSADAPGEWFATVATALVAPDEFGGRVELLRSVSSRK